MRKISDIRGEDALDILAELIEPAGELINDKIVVAYLKAGKKYSAIRQAIKGHKKAVLRMLAILEGEDPKTYAPSVLEIPAKLIILLNDPAFVDVFPSAVTEIISGSATESTEETEEA